MRRILIILLALFLLLSTIGYFIYLYNIKYNNLVLGQNIDGIAVLTGGKGRIKLGLNLLAEDSRVKLIISGVDKKAPISSILSSSLQEDNRIQIDRESQSTFDNALVITKWAKKNKLININVITSFYHMPRSMMLLNRFTNNINYYAYPVQRKESISHNSLQNIQFTLFLIEEYIKYLLSHIIIMLY